MNMDFREVKVDQNALRFSQDSIAEYIRSPWGENVPLMENLKKLKSGELHPDDFPALEVSADEDRVLWSENNRRLWLFRKAGISQITVHLFSKPLDRAPPRSDSDRALMSTPHFFPWIRQQRQTTSSVSAQLIDTEAVVELNPNEIRFSEKSIGPYWTTPSGTNVPLEENLKKLKSGQLSPSDFRRLEVAKDKDGVLWANDNKVLWLFRKAGISRITVNVSNKPLSRALPRSDSDLALMSTQDFFPRIRGQLQETASKSTQLNPDDSDALVKLNPNAIRFSEESIAPHLTTDKGENVPLEEVLKVLKGGQPNPDAFRPLEVTRDKDGVLWTNDNERLWLFRNAGISQIPVKVFSKPLCREPPRIDRDRAFISAPDFFPSIPTPSQETASKSTELMSNAINALLVGAAVTASVLLLGSGFAGWKLSALVLGFAGCMWYKQY